MPLLVEGEAVEGEEEEEGVVEAGADMNTVDLIVDSRVDPDMAVVAGEMTNVVRNITTRNESSVLIPMKTRVTDTGIIEGINHMIMMTV